MSQDDNFEIQKCVASASLVPNNLTIMDNVKAFAHKSKVVVRVPGEKSVLFKEVGNVTAIKHVHCGEDFLVVCCEFGHISLYNKEHRKGIAAAQKKGLSQEDITLSSIASDGKNRLFIGWNLGVTVYEVQKKKIVESFTTTQKVPVTSMAFSDGRLYVGDEKGGIYIYEIKTDKMERTHKFDGNGSPANSIVVLAESKKRSGTLVCGCDDGNITIIDLKSTSIMGTLTGHAGPITALDAHPYKKNRFASVGEDSFLNIWDVGEGKVSVVKSVALTTKLATGVAYCKGATHVVVTFYDDSQIFMLTTT